MPVIYRNASGTDFDDLYEPWQSGVKIVTGYRASSGVDHGQRYQAIAAGLGSAGPSCGYRDSSGTDIGTRFVAKGSMPPPYTPITSVGISGAAVVSSPPGGGASTTLTANANGSSSSKTYVWTKISGTRMNIFGSTTNQSVTIVSTRSNNSFSQDDGTFQCTVSDGTSSASGQTDVSFIGIA